MMQHKKTLISAAIAALALSVLAANATNYSGKVSLIQTEMCEQQAWPNYSADCLLSGQNREPATQLRTIKFEPETE